MFERLRRLFRIHRHSWSDPECRIMNVTDEAGAVRSTRHAHVKWCDSCGDYTMVYGLKCPKASR